MIEGYLGEHRFLRLGTVGEGGGPVVHTVGYVAEGSVVYFATERRTRKAQNIAREPRVAYTVDREYARVSEIRGVQMIGRAFEVTDIAEVSRVMGRFAVRFPELATLKFEGAPVIFRVEPVLGSFIDNSKGFGHKEDCSY